MAYVITRLCRDCVDSACVEVCPVDCIFEPKAGTGLPNQLFIEPDQCIDCACCEPACPWEAIALDDEVARLFHDDIALNTIVAARPHDFVSATLRKRPRPTADEVEANRKKWEDASRSGSAGSASGEGEPAPHTS
jgi:ferredoxin